MAARCLYDSDDGLYYSSAVYTAENWHALTQFKSMMINTSDGILKIDTSREPAHIGDDAVFAIPVVWDNMDSVVPQRKTSQDRTNTGTTKSQKKAARKMRTKAAVANKK